MLDPKYIPLFLGGFILWMIFVISIGFFGSCGKRSGQKFLTGGSDMSLKSGTVTVHLDGDSVSLRHPPRVKYGAGEICLVVQSRIVKYGTIMLHFMKSVDGLWQMTKFRPYSLIVLAVLAVFARAVGFSYIGLDDAGYTFRNPFVATGFSWANIVECFTNFRHGGIWMPFTYISYMIDMDASRITGMQLSTCMHLVNVLLHVLNDRQDDRIRRAGQGGPQR